MARQRNSCEKCSFSSRKDKVTQGTKKPLWIQYCIMLCHTSRKMYLQPQHYWSSDPIFSNYLFHLFVWGSVFLLGMGLLLLLGFLLVWPGLVGFFVWLCWLVISPGLPYRFCGNAEMQKPTAALWNTEHVTCELGTVLSRADTYPVLSGKLEAPYIQSNGEFWCTLVPKIAMWSFNISK